MRFSFGDILPFLVIGLFWVLAFFFPRVEIGLMVGWSLFVTGGLIRSFMIVKDKSGNPVFLWCLFNIPTFVAGLIVWWRW